MQRCEALPAMEAPSSRTNEPQTPNRSVHEAISPTIRKVRCRCRARPSVWQAWPRAGADRDQIQPRGGKRHAEGQRFAEVQGTCRETYWREGESRSLSELAAV